MTATISTLNFLSNTDESCKDETRVSGDNRNIIPNSRVENALYKSFGSVVD